MEKEPKPSILIVDDDRSNLDVLVHILRPEYNILVAKSGQGALKSAEERQPDLILLDLVMPDMDGFEVLLELKKSEATRFIPVVFITGQTNNDAEARGFFLGAADYIRKPFHDAVVRARVGNQIRLLRQLRAIERMGLTDSLTDIPNRRGFDRQLDAEWRRACRDKSPLSLLMIDVDKFKQFNDAYGHPQGDELLHRLSDIFRKSLKRAGDFSARVGGEEFAVLLPSTPLEGALTVAEEIRRTVERAAFPRPGSSGASSITVSIGACAVIPDASKPPTEFLVCADQALYAAKNSGRNRVCF